MGFSEAIQDAASKYATFEGRSSRSAYWWWWLFTLLCYVALSVIDQLVGTAVVLTIIAWVILFLPSLAVFVRRLHDSGKTGWWWFIGLVPLIGFIVLLVFLLTPSDEGPNQYGDAPDLPADGGKPIA